MTAEEAKMLVLLIIGGLNIVISLMTTYFKPISLKFYTIPAEYRGLAMLGMVVLTTGLIFGLSCTPLFAFVPCTVKSLSDLATAMFVGIATNQFTFIMSPTSPAKSQIRLEALIEAQNAPKEPIIDPEDDEN